MDRKKVEELIDHEKMTDETLTFLNKRKLNDMVDGRVSYHEKKENFKMRNKYEGKLKKNVFVHCDDKDRVSFKVFKDKYTEEPKEDGDIYGKIYYKHCNDPDKMLGQIRYLVGFDWCNKDIIEQFIHSVETFHIGYTGKLLFKGEGR